MHVKVIQFNAGPDPCPYLGSVGDIRSSFVSTPNETHWPLPASPRRRLLTAHPCMHMQGEKRKRKKRIGRQVARVTTRGDHTECGGGLGIAMTSAVVPIVPATAKIGRKTLGRLRTRMHRYNHESGPGSMGRYKHNNDVAMQTACLSRCTFPPINDEPHPPRPLPDPSTRIRGEKRQAPSFMLVASSGSLLTKSPSWRLPGHPFDSPPSGGGMKGGQEQTAYLA